MKNKCARTTILRPCDRRGEEVGVANSCATRTVTIFRSASNRWLSTHHRINISICLQYTNINHILGCMVLNETAATHLESSRNGVGLCSPAVSSIGGVIKNQGSHTSTKCLYVCVLYSIGEKKRVFAAHLQSVLGINMHIQ